MRANDEEDPNKRLSETELIAQLTYVNVIIYCSHAIIHIVSSLLIIAGHDTTAASLSWMMWELSKRPESQSRLRAEIREHRQRVGHGTDFTQADYDSMSYLNASIKASRMQCCNAETY